MPESRGIEIRVYCVCGQKMKVSPSMYGLPGKCVACRQKIRIPRPDQLPEGLTDIHLKDHPEFLRKPKRPRADAQFKKQGPQTPASQLPPEAPKVIPLDILEPLRLLESFKQKLEKQQEIAPNPSLAKYKKQIDSARARLDQQMQSRLVEATLELQSTSDQIAQAGVAVRVGDVAFAEFLKTVASLRARRDELERLQHNLKGWLAVTDIHAAGGYVEASFDAIPPEGLRYFFPLQTEENLSLLDQHVDGLREAFQERERAERNIRATEKLREEGNQPADSLSECLAASKAEKARATAEISFLRKRLDQLSKDSAADAQTIQACLDALRKKFSTNQLDKSRYIFLYKELLHAQRDCARAHDLITRTLIAGTAQEVPPLKGSFLRRMAPAAVQPMAERPSLDMWLAWASGLLLLVAAAFPLIDDVSPISLLGNGDAHSQGLHGFMLFPILAGLLMAGAGAIRPRTLRAITLGLLWTTLSILTTWLAHEAQYSMADVAVRFREGEHYLTRSGAILIIFANLTALAAALVALTRSRRLLILASTGITLTLLASMLIITDAFHHLTPKPILSISSIPSPSASAFMYDTAITVQNAGHRALVFGPPKSTALNAYTYTLQQEIEPGQWRDLRLHERVELLVKKQTVPVTKLRNLIVGANDSVRFQYQLEPGQYRVEIRRTVSPEIISETFALEPPALQPQDEPAPEPEPEPVIEPEVVSEPDPVPSVTERVDIELRGVITGANKQPRFSIALYPRNGDNTKFRDALIGDQIHNDWTITEYNPARQTITLENNGKILILNRGERILLE